jgi:dUTP pyrophosphatase
MLNIKVKKLHPEAVIPKYSRDGDAGLDLTAISVSIEKDWISYDTGLSFEIPNGYVGLIFPRSSISNTGLALSNAVGVIDSNYRGSVSFRFRVVSDNQRIYALGDRIGQLVIMPYPNVVLKEVEQLTNTERGSGSYGSSGT